MVRPAKRGRIAPDPMEPSTWHTRGEVAEILGVHRSTVARHEALGRLHALLDDRGVHRFSPGEVRALLHSPRRKSKQRDPARPLGEIEADVFAMLSQGFTRREVVLRLRITSDDAQRYWEKWNCETFEEAARIERQRAQQQQRDAMAQKLREEEERQRKEIDAQQRHLEEINAAMLAAFIAWLLATGKARDWLELAVTLKASK